MRVPKGVVLRTDLLCRVAEDRSVVFRLKDQFVHDSDLWEFDILYLDKDEWEPSPAPGWFGDEGLLDAMYTPLKATYTPLDHSDV